MTRRTAGFTLIEMVFAILIGTILTGIALSTIQTAQSRYATRSAKNMYATMQQRARSRAIESGETILLFVDTAGDSAYTYTLTGGLHDVVRFRPDLNVDIRSSASMFMLCMTPRGYADYECGSLRMYGVTASSNSATRLEFWRGGDSTSVVILPMGQLVGM